MDPSHLTPPHWVGFNKSICTIIILLNNIFHKIFKTINHKSKMMVLRSIAQRISTDENSLSRSYVEYSCWAPSPGYIFLFSLWCCSCVMLGAILGDQVHHNPSSACQHRPHTERRIISLPHLSSLQHTGNIIIIGIRGQLYAQFFPTDVMYINSSGGTGEIVQIVW